MQAGFKSLLLIALFCMLPEMARGEQFLCMPEKSIGFVYDRATKAWTTADFGNEEHYIIASPSVTNGYLYTWTVVGQKTPDALCGKDFTEAGILHCKPLGGDIFFNKNNGRYVRTHWLGYYNVGLPGDFGATDRQVVIRQVQIGKCSPL